MPPAGINVPPVDAGMNKRPTPGDPEVKPNSKYDPSSDADSNKEKEEKKAKRDAKRRDQEIIREAVKRFKMCVDAEKDNRDAAQEDLEFKAGKQWPADIMAERNADKRPCMTINSSKTLTHQITNDIRQNRPGINISPLGDEATKEAAETRASFIRAIERESAADIAYDTAIGSAVDIGFGYIRVTSEYESPDTFNQVLVIKRVRNTFTVHLDPMRQEPDGSDSGFGFQSELVPRDEFKMRHPAAVEVPWTQTDIGEGYKEWVSKDTIRVAEYFSIEYEKRRLVQLSSGHTGWYDELAESVLADLGAGRVTIKNDRMSDVPCVMWYRLTSREVLESQKWPGRWIPIVEVLGDEIDLAGKVIRSGVLRDAKDPMRAKNYSVTAKMESVALGPKAHYIMAEGQDEGYESDWEQANRKPLPRLIYVPVVGENGQLAPPPQRIAPPQPSAGWVEMEKSSEQDILRTTGVRFDASLSERRYDESGKMLREERRNTDIGSFHYSDNFSRSLRHLGRMLLDLMPHYYDSERFVPGVNEDGTDTRIKIDPGLTKPVAKIQDPANPNSLVKAINLKRGNFSVTVTTGPSYASRRIEAQEQMSGFLAKVPEQMRGVVAALIAKYSDWPGANELFRAITKMLPAGVLMPDMKDLPPALGAMVQALEAQIKQLMTERMQLLREVTDKRVDQSLAKDKIEKDFEAKILKVIADLHKAMESSLMQPMESMAEMVGSIEAKFKEFHAVGDPLAAQARAAMSGGAPAAPAALPAPGGLQ